MGTLLSTPEGNASENYGCQDMEMEMQQATGKRKRRTMNGDTVKPRKRQKRDTTTSAHFNNSIMVTHESHANAAVFGASATDADTVARNISALDETSKPAKKNRSRKSRKTQAEQLDRPKHKHKSSIRETAAGPLRPQNETTTNSTEQSSFIQDEPLIGPPTPVQKPRNRPRKQPTSPYFPLPPNHLSSPSPTPPTPTPKRTLSNTSPKSKVSIIEAPGVLPSLPHFRPTSANEFGLIQEKLRHEPWKMLVAVIFLNVTTAKMALPLLGQFFEQWPDAESLSKGTKPISTTHIPNILFLSSGIPKTPLLSLDTVCS